MCSLEVALDGGNLVVEEDDFHFRVTVAVNVRGAGDAHGGLGFGLGGITQEGFDLSGSHPGFDVREFVRC